MRFFAAVAFLVACGHTATAPALGEDIEVRHDAAVTIPGDTLTVHFTDVTSDSRCATGVTCVWAGEATGVFTIGGNEQVTLTLGADTTTARAIVRGYQMTLVALKPHPTAGGSPAKGDYLATLRFTSAKD